jgi:hypothetical protein
MRNKGGQEAVYTLYCSWVLVWDTGDQCLLDLLVLPSSFLQGISNFLPRKAKLLGDFHVREALRTGSSYLQCANKNGVTVSPAPLVPGICQPNKKKEFAKQRASVRQMAQE